MTHKIRDVERRQLLNSLETANDGDWIKIASEIDYRRNQIYYWFLIESEAVLERAAKKVMAVIHPFAIERPGAEFNVGFIELTDAHKIGWDTIDDDELRRGTLRRAIGDDPWTTARPKTSVFDRPDYAIPESQEP